MAFTKRNRGVRPNLPSANAENFRMATYPRYMPLLVFVRTCSLPEERAKEFDKRIRDQIQPVCRFTGCAIWLPTTRRSNDGQVDRLHYNGVAVATLAMASPGRGQEPMQVSGTAITTQVEDHFILAGDQVHGFGVDKAGRSHKRAGKRSI